MEELVSIILPVFNRATLVQDAIESVIKQTYKNWELIIINDGSQDESETIILPYLKDDRIQYHYSSNNCGLASTRNKGLTIAKGKYIGFIDDDDIYNEKKIEKQVNFLKCNPYYNLVGTFAVAMVINQENGVVQTIKKKSFIGAGAIHLKNMTLEEKFFTGFCGTSALFTKQTLDSIQGFRSFFKISEDYDTHLRFLEKFCGYVLDEYLYIYRETASSMTRSNQYRQWLYHSLGFMSHYYRLHTNTDPVDTDSLLSIKLKFIQRMPQEWQKIIYDRAIDYLKRVVRSNNEDEFFRILAILDRMFSCNGNFLQNIRRTFISYCCRHFHWKLAIKLFFMRNTTLWRESLLSSWENVLYAEKYKII